MDDIIWLVIMTIAIMILKYAGISLGGIPTFILGMATYGIARILYKKIKSKHSHNNEDNKSDKKNDDET